MAERRSTWWWVGWSAACVLAMSLTAWSTTGLHIGHGISPLWPPAGIALAWLMVAGVRGVPAVVLGRLLGTFMIDGWWIGDDTTATQLGRLTAVTVAYTVAALALRRIGIHHARLREFGWFALIGVAWAPALAAALSTLSDAITLDLTTDEFLKGSRTFWVGDAIGVLTVTPPLLLLEFRRRIGTKGPRLPAGRLQRVESALQAVAIVLTPIVALSIDADSDHVTPLLVLAVLPLVWVAMRQDLVVAALGVLVLNISITLTAARQLGPGAALVELQVVMLAGALAAYYVAALVHTTNENVADLIESEARYQALTQSTPDLVIHLDLDGTVSNHNDPPWPHGAAAWAHVLAEELRTQWQARLDALRQGGTHATKPLLHPDLGVSMARLAIAEHQVSDPVAPVPHGAATTTGAHGGAVDGEPADREQVAPSSSTNGTGPLAPGGRRLVELRLLPHRSASGRIVGVVAVATDRTAEREATAKLEWAQQHDSLTGLANASMLSDRLGSDLAQRGEGTIALAMVDLDHFRIINHSLGHRVGDEVLVSVAQRLKAAARPGDLVARMSADLFGVAMRLRDGRDVLRSVDHLAAAVRAAEVMDLDGGEHRLTACIGLATATSSTASARELIRDADTAMNVAKGSGPDSVTVFDDHLRELALARQSTVAGLHRAIASGDLVVHFQPVVDLRSGATRGVEALVRWKTPDGLRYPGDFVELAEQVGIDVAMGTRVNELAVAAMASWHERLEEGTRPSLSVNVTARQIRWPRFCEDLLETCERHGLDPTCLSLELTETSVMSDPDATIPVMERLREAGIRMSLDDFGTGYSSIAHLHRLPVDVLKIDRSFVSGLPEAEDSRQIVKLVMEMADALDISVTAEGIETEAQRRCLMELGCTFGQGYLFARPDDPESLFERLPVPTPVEQP